MVQFEGFDYGKGGYFMNEQTTFEGLESRSQAVGFDAMNLTFGDGTALVKAVQEYMNHVTGEDLIDISEATMVISGTLAFLTSAQNRQAVGAHQHG